LDRGGHSTPDPDVHRVVVIEGVVQRHLSAGGARNLSIHPPLLGRSSLGMTTETRSHGGTDGDERSENNDAETIFLFSDPLSVSPGLRG
jgi:hypothetical protein